jgi:hypothetical protein
VPLRHARRTASLAVGTALALGGVALAAPGTEQGPSSSATPYLLRAVPGVVTTSVLTVGDTVGGYRMVGIPDGLGAYDNGDGTFTVLMNHELGADKGVVRAHGAKGSFVSRWVVRKDTLQVVSGSDAFTTFVHADGGADALARLCSSDLAPVSAFFDAASGLGYDGRVYLTGEENGAVGRAIGVVVDEATAYELPALGKAGWENLAANPATGARTVVVGQSDGGNGNVLVYAGDKLATGSAIERAGLTNGVSRSLQVTGYAQEGGDVAFPATPQPFTLAPAGTAGTSFDRPEDGAWDPENPNDYYFVTTGSISRSSRLWKLAFVDAARPELGGTITKLVEGPAADDPASPGPKMMDNLTVTDGQVLIQEDPGNTAYLAGVFQYDLATGALRRIARHDADRFAPGGADFQTRDEESSGIIPAPFLGAGKYLLDVQEHLAVSDPELVEKGQLLVLHVPPGQPLR